MKRTIRSSYAFGAAGAAITALTLAGVYLPLHCSAPFFQAVRASADQWLPVFFAVPAVSLAGILLCRSERKKGTGGSALWWVNCVLCWGIFFWSSGVLLLGYLLALFMRHWAR